MTRRHEMAAMSAAEEAHGLGKLRSSRSSSIRIGAPALALRRACQIETTGHIIWP